GIAIEHRVLRPEMAIEQMMRAEVQSLMELAHVQTFEQMGVRGILAQTTSHALRRHHELQQSRERRDTGGDKIEMVSDVLDAEFVIATFRTVQRQFVHAVAEPMI